MDVKLRVFKAVAYEKRIRLIKLLYEKGKMPLRDISASKEMGSNLV